MEFSINATFCTMLYYNSDTHAYSNNFLNDVQPLLLDSLKHSAQFLERNASLVSVSHPKVRHSDLREELLEEDMHKLYQWKNSTFILLETSML